jgi:hypothetical protein
VNKTGTSTLHARLPTFNRELNKTLSRHITISDLSRLSIYDRCKDYFKFCFVRNPYEYFYSRCQFDASPRYIEHCEDQGRNNPYWKMSETQLNKLKQCNDDNGNFLFDFYLDSFDALSQISEDGFFKQWTHLNKKCAMNFIGKNENFEEDFKKACEIIGLPYNEIPTLSKNINKEPLTQRGNSFFGDGSVYKYLHYYDTKTLEAINNKFRQDFQLFDYRMITSNELIEYKKWYSNEQN